MRYTAPRATTLLAVTNFIPVSSNSVGQVIYAVATDLAGNLLARTPNYTVQPADLNTTVTFTFPTPLLLAAGDFLAGIAQIASPVAHYPVGMLVENPRRTGAYYDRGRLVSGLFNDAAQFNYGPFAIQAVLTNTVLGSGASTAARSTFALMPNPTRHTAHLLLGTPATAATTAQVLAPLGRVVLSYPLPARATEAWLDVAGLPRGLYIVRVGSAAQRLLLD